jgi:predicted nucleotidyltransferase
VVDIEALKHEIVERLKPLDPDKIILFGSYAYGTPNEDSDIDLFLVKDNISDDDLDRYEIEAMMNTRDLISKYHIGFDILSASSSFLNAREDYFYKIDILEKGKVFYERSVS